MLSDRVSFGVPGLRRLQQLVLRNLFRMPVAGTVPEHNFWLSFVPDATEGHVAKIGKY